MKKKRIKVREKRLILGLALAAAAIFAAWMLWPRPLAGAFDAGAPFTAVVARIDEAHPVWTDDYEQYRRMESAALAAVLEGYSYHLCWDTLHEKPGTNISDGGGRTLLHMVNGQGHTLASAGASRIYLNDRVVKVGYFGNSQSVRLQQDILAALEAE